MDPRQVNDFIIVPVLRRLDPVIPYSEAARRLLLGTAAHESAGFRFIDQKTNGPGDPPGPAYGIFQMEDATYRDCWERFLAGRGALSLLIRGERGVSPEGISALHGNHNYAAAMARAQYYRQPFKLAHDASLEELAAIWKQYWNTPLGAGTAAQWLMHYPKGL